MEKSVVKRAQEQLTGLMMIRGVFAIIFGILALVWPGMTLVSLSILTAVWLFVNGITGALTSIFMRRNYEYWFLRLLLSLVQFGVGAYLVQRPGISIATFMLAVGLSFIVEGVIELALSFSGSSQDGGSRSLDAIVGLLTIAGGILIWRYPVSGSLAFVWILGLLALIGGTMTLWLAISMRHEAQN